MKAFLEHAIESEEMLDKDFLTEYARYYSQNKNWLFSTIKNMSIQEVINMACDELEDEGFDLQETSIEKVFNKIESTIKIEIREPKEYTQLIAALESANKSLSFMNSLSVPNDESKNSILQIIQSIESQIKRIKNGEY